ncbi:MAG: hypothetical protein Q8S73_01945 [Deltaproteobacteria bacterium]|nr:hypothetical protein [Myxococcales bacterium]MDP3212838.1 hypothetical protein [Deltaproteobacteria bacterium]
MKHHETSLARRPFEGAAPLRRLAAFDRPEVDAAIERRPAVHPPLGAWELDILDLDLDPREERNRYDDEPARAAELRSRLLDSGGGRR